MPKQHFIAMVSDSKLHAIILSGPILESKGMHAIFQKKGQKVQSIWKLTQKCTKLENILKKASLMHSTIACLKQLKHALIMVRDWHEIEYNRENNRVRNDNESQKNIACFQSYRTDF